MSKKQKPKPIVIKKKWIDLAETYGACDEAIAWLRRRPRTIESLCKNRYIWAGWVFCNGHCHVVPKYVVKRIEHLLYGE